MKKSVLTAFFLFLSPLCVEPAVQDVNQDGRVDKTDVTALARMVAGLDPANLSYDQNGDGELTMEDVNELLDSMPPEGVDNPGTGPVLGFSNSNQTPPGPTPAPSPSTSPPPVQQGEGLAFYAIRQKSTGQCVVVAGAEGISPGDTIFGAFPSFQPAQEALMRQCVGGQAPPPTPLPSQPTQVEPLYASLFASPILAVPKYDNDESTKGIFFISLETGNAFFIDKVKGSPLSVRTRTLNQNVFKALGRTPGQSARHGDILVGSIRSKSGQMHALLLVDTTSGSMSYISELDSRSYEGRLQPIRGKPGLDIIGEASQFALVMCEDPSGKTAGAFLINGTSGNSVYLDGIGDLEPYLQVRRTPSIPPMASGFSALAIHAKDESTSHMLLVDHSSGALHHLSLPRKRPWDFEVRTLARDVFVGLPKNATVQTPHRFIAIPITSGSGATDNALIVDIGTGSMLLIQNLRDVNKTLLVGVHRNIYEKLPREVARPRVITSVPKIDSSGATEGAWLFDSVTGNIIFLDHLQDPGRLEIHTVEERAR